MAFSSIPDLILEHNIEHVGQNLRQMMDNDDRPCRIIQPMPQNTLRPILGRKGSLPEPPTYARKMSVDSVMSDGLLCTKTTLMPTRSSYFDEVRPKNPKCFGKNFLRRGSHHSTYMDNYFQSEKEMSLEALNIFPKVYPPVPPKDLPQVLKTLEERLLLFVELSYNLHNIQPNTFAVIDKDAGIIKGIKQYFAYLITLASREEQWIFSIVPALNLKDKFQDSFNTLSQEFHKVITEAHKVTGSTGDFDESHEMFESAEELTYCVRTFYTFIWLCLRLNKYPCQVQERNLFIGF